MSGGGGEMRGFVFAVVFIVIFSTLLSSVPAGLQGPNEEPETVIPIDPNILTGFAEIEEYQQDNYTGGPYLFLYDYDAFGGRDWRSYSDNETFIRLGAKVYIGPFWFGGIDYCKFTAPSGLDRGTQLFFEEINTDAEEGLIRYSLQLSDSGDSAGSFIVYWNETAYADITDAWENDEAYFLHGLGFAETATTNIGGLIISLLFLQLPDVPPLINLFIAVPIWACIIYVLWYIIKEMIPFV